MADLVFVHCLNKADFDTIRLKADGQGLGWNLDTSTTSRPKDRLCEPLKAYKSLSLAQTPDGENNTDVRVFETYLVSDSGDVTQKALAWKVKEALDIFHREGIEGSGDSDI